eukprot:jgi/Ulvmu1/9481/UM052_0050.1
MRVHRATHSSKSADAGCDDSPQPSPFPRLGCKKASSGAAPVTVAGDKHWRSNHTDPATAQQPPSAAIHCLQIQMGASGLRVREVAAAGHASVAQPGSSTAEVLPGSLKATRGLHRLCIMHSLHRLHTGPPCNKVVQVVQRTPIQEPFHNQLGEKCPRLRVCAP